MPDYTLHKGKRARVDGVTCHLSLHAWLLTPLWVFAAHFNNFLKEYTDATTDEQKYMVQLVSARHRLLLMPRCSGALLWQCLSTKD